MEILNIKAIGSLITDKTENDGVLIFKDIEVARMVHKCLDRYLSANDESKKLSIAVVYDSNA